MTREEFKVAFSENLKTLRNKRHLTQKALGMLCGFDENLAERGVQRWEYCESIPPTEKLRALATALKCTIDELIP